MMKKQIISFINSLKSNKKLSSFDEAATKQAVVLRLISFLGWDIFNVDEVYPDFAANSQRVAFALRIKNTSKVFIEVKRVHEKLDNHQKQLITLATQERVDLCILTNGITWWFYLPSANGDWQKKWFYSANLLKQKADVLVPQLVDLLSKSKIAKGQAFKSAKLLYKTKKQKMAAEFIPEAWNRVISEPNKIFVELLSETTEKLCGFKVDSQLIEKFLRQNLEKWKIKDISRTKVAPPPHIAELPAPPSHRPESQAPPPRPVPKVVVTPKIVAPPKKESYADKLIKSFSFNGRTYRIRHWEDLLTILCNSLAASEGKDFEKVLWISGYRDARFSRYKDQLRIPEKIAKTDIYVETKLGPDDIVKTARNLIAEFGYKKDMLVVTTQ